MGPRRAREAEREAPDELTAGASSPIGAAASAPIPEPCAKRRDTPAAHRRRPRALCEPGARPCNRRQLRGAPSFGYGGTASVGGAAARRIFHARDHGRRGRQPCGTVACGAQSGLGSAGAAAGRPRDGGHGTHDARRARRPRSATPLGDHGVCRAGRSGSGRDRRRGAAARPLVVAGHGGAAKRRSSGGPYVGRGVREHPSGVRVHRRHAATGAERARDAAPRSA